MSRPAIGRYAVVQLVRTMSPMRKKTCANQPTMRVGGRCHHQPIQRGSVAQIMLEERNSLLNRRYPAQAIPQRRRPLKSLWEIRRATHTARAVKTSFRINLSSYYLSDPLCLLTGNGSGLAPNTNRSLFKDRTEES